MTRVGEYIDRPSLALNSIDVHRTPTIVQEVVNPFNRFRQHADISVGELTRMIKMIKE